MRVPAFAPFFWLSYENLVVNEFTIGEQGMKTVGLGLVILVVALPLAFLITMITFPFWCWFETVSGIESFGQSGPSQWCYWVVYALLVWCAGFVWCLRRRSAK